MPAHKKPVPAYRLHKSSGQAVVTVNLNGKRKDMLLGAYGSPESKEEYQRVLADLHAGRLAHGIPADLTVTELCHRYWLFAEDYYRHPDGTKTAEVDDMRAAIRLFRLTVGEMPAREFGPLAFKTVRDAMVAKGWARSTVNSQAARVKRIIRWAVENELVPADRWEGLRAVRGLVAGRTQARETEPVKPVEEHHFRAVLPLVRPQVRALLELIAVTGMRPGEACRIRPIEVDASGEVWIYRPRQHKTLHRGKVRVVQLGAGRKRS